MKNRLHEIVVPEINWKGAERFHDLLEKKEKNQSQSEKLAKSIIERDCWGGGGGDAMLAISLWRIAPVMGQGIYNRGSC